MSLTLCPAWISIRNSKQTILTLIYRNAMCHYFEVKLVYKGCMKGPKHMHFNKKYDRCEKSPVKDYLCVNATPAKGLNGEIIQMTSTRRPGECPKCYSLDTVGDIRQNSTDSC